LSIVPPGEAVALAQRLAPALTRASRKPIYVDCNAISPATALEIGTVLEPTREIEQGDAPVLIVGRPCAFGVG
jgi:3-hydroxyisobutyrate dehydrogenase-like beta-hydroxyacid dehydrogenase